jgi:acetyl esterase/lipase
MNMPMKWFLIVLGALAVTGFSVGAASSWSLLGLMNRLDGTFTTDEAIRAAHGIAYGADPRQKLNIWQPKSIMHKAASHSPVVVFFYGGSWRDGARDFYDFYGRALAARGFVVVIPDYRVTPKFRFPAFVEDGASAVTWTRVNISKYGGDPARISVAGHSAGAHIAAMITLDKQWLTKAGAPDGTIRSFVGLAGPYDFLPFTTDASKAAFAHEPDPSVTQPITFVRKDAPPMLLLTGTADTTVKPRNSRALAAAQTKLGAAATLKEYIGVDHSEIIQSFARPFREKSSALADTTEFLSAHSQPLDKPTVAQ